MKHKQFKITGALTPNLRAQIAEMFKNGYIHNGGNTMVIIEESYSFRNNSSLGITTILEWTDDTELIGKTIATGAGEGIFNFGWGVEGDRINNRLKNLKELAEKSGLVFEEIAQA